MSIVIITIITLWLVGAAQDGCCIDTSTHTHVGPWDFSGAFHVKRSKGCFALTNVIEFNYGDYVLFLFLLFCEY